MLTLERLRHFRILRDLGRGTLSKVCDIPMPRLREIELGHAEPWFDEALLIARILCVPEIEMLMQIPETVTFETDPTFYAADVEYWRSGVRLPLSVAYRLKKRFGLSTVNELVVEPLSRQMWAVVSSNERGAVAGQCPWCLAISGTEDHLPTCLPHNLMGPRLIGGDMREAVVGYARPLRKGRQLGSAPGRGLKAIRESKRMTQDEFARAAGINGNYYARMERCQIMLTIKTARKLAIAYNLDMATLYARPEGEDIPVEQELEAEGYTVG